MNDEVTIPGRYDRIADVCKFVAGGAEQVGFNVDDIFKIELACDEACTNIIEHAYEGQEDVGEIWIQWRFVNDVFIITICDSGKSFDPSEVQEPNIPANPDNLDELQIGGLGLHFMRKLMDQVQFFAGSECGNKLIMYKQLTTRS